jgi:hypothetical protein
MVKRGVVPLVVFKTLGGARFTKQNSAPKRLERVIVFHHVFHEIIIISWGPIMLIRAK